MQDGNYDWLNKLEGKIDTVSLEFARGVTEIKTKLDIYLSRQDDHEVRLSKVESRQSEQKGVHDESIRKINQMTLGVLAVTAIIVGGRCLAVVCGQSLR